MATVTIGTESISAEAECYRTLDAAQAKECAEKKPSKSIELPEGEALRIGVDPEVAETGWALWINGREATNDTFDKTYWSFDNPGLFATSGSTPMRRALPSGSSIDLDGFSSAHSLACAASRVR